MTIENLAKAIGEAVHETDPNIKIEGFHIRYPEQSPIHGREDFDLRDMARAVVKGCIYTL